MKASETAAVCLHFPTNSLTYKAAFQMNGIMGLTMKSAHISMITSAVRAAVRTFTRIDTLLEEVKQTASDVLCFEQIGSRCISSKGWDSDLFVFYLGQARDGDIFNCGFKISIVDAVSKFLQNTNKNKKITSLQHTVRQAIFKSLKNDWPALISRRPRC